MDRIDQVDVVFPTRNRLEESLITIQKMVAIGIKENQITVGDDASGPKLAVEIKSRFPGVHVVSNLSPKGQLATRNDLFAQTFRKYILSIDDDSHIISANELNEAISILESDPQAGIFGFRAFQQLNSPPPGKELDTKLFQVRTFIACGALIKRECLQRIGNYTREALGYYCEEIDCSIRVFKNGFKVVTKNDLVVHHRVNRNYKEMPKQTDVSKGVFGTEWRSVMGFSDNLIVTLIYFPMGFDVLFFFIYVAKRFFLFTLKNSDYRAFFQGLMRTARFLPYIVKEKNSMTYQSFFQWIRLPMM